MEFEYFSEIIYVTGNIKVSSNKFSCPFLVAFADDSNRTFATKIIEGDYDIDDEEVSVIPSCSLLMAKNDIIGYSISSKMTTPQECCAYFNDCINSLEKLIQTDLIPEDQINLLLRMAYVGVFSAYEGYVIRMLEVMFPYFYKKYFDVFVKQDGLSLKEKEYKSMEKYRRLYVNNASILNDCLHSLFNFKISEEIAGDLYEKYNIRNGIVHRNGMIEDGDIITISKNDIHGIILHAKKLVNFLDDKFVKLVIPYPR